MNPKRILVTAAALASVATVAVGSAGTASAAGVSGPAIYVEHVLYRTVATPTDLSGTGAPAHSWDTIYNFFGAQKSVATAAPAGRCTRCRPPTATRLRWRPVTATATGCWTRLPR